MRNKTKKNIVKSKILAIFAKKLLWFISGLFIAMQVFFTIETAGSGAKLVKLEKIESYLIEEKQTLSEELAKSTSLLNLANSAESLGFIKPSKTLYIGIDEIVAKAP